MRAFFYPICIVFSLVACSEGLKSEDTQIDESLILYEESEEGRNYMVDSVKSIVSWVGANSETWHYGIAHIKSGRFTIKDSMIVGGEILIDMTRIDILDLKDNAAESARLSDFLDSKEMFYTRNYPVARFVIDSVRVIPVSSRKIARSQAENSVPVIDPTHTIYGKLTVRSTTRNLDFPARIDMRYYKLQSSAGFNISRTDLGIDPGDLRHYGSGPQYVIPETVNIGFDIIAEAR